MDAPLCNRCGKRGCFGHPGPLTRRIAELHPEPVEDKRPAWMKHLTPRDLTGQMR